MKIDLAIDEADLKRAMEQFQRLPDKVNRKVGRAAVSAGVTVVLRQARSEVPIDEGTLRASLGRKVKNYPSSQLTVGIAGSRISGNKRGYHAHLVEHGHVAADGSFVPGNPWLARAVAAAEGQAIERMQRKLFAGIDKEARR